MSDDVTPRLALPLLAAGQAQKEVLVNEAWQRLDALAQPVAQSATLTVPPASPELGLCWIVGGAATGVWAGKDGCIAQWTAGGWRFSTPLDGWRCFILDRGAAMTFGEEQWRDELVRSDGIYVDGNKVVGSRMDDIVPPTGGTIIDDEARAVINELLTVLRGHGLIES